MGLNSLNILSWNARGLRDKAQLLKTVLQERKIDVALLSETYLKPNSRIQFPVYAVYRLNHSDPIVQRRGLAVLVRRDIVHRALRATGTTSFLTLGVEVNLNATRTRLYAAYKPPQNALDISDIRRLLLEEPAVIAGDLNAKHPVWNAAITNPAGRKLQADSQARGYKVLGPDVPTHYPECPTYRPDVLDIVIAHKIRGAITQELHRLDTAMGSDHNPVVTTIASTPTRLPPPPLPRKVDWEMFSESLHSSTPNFPVESPSDVERLLAELESAIKTAQEGATTEATDRRGRTKQPTHPTLILKFQEKRRLRRLWQSTRCPHTKNALNRLTNQIKTELAASSAEFWERRIESAAEDASSLHRVCRQLTGTPASTRPLLHEDGDLRQRQHFC